MTRCYYLSLLVILVLLPWWWIIIPYRIIPKLWSTSAPVDVAKKCYDEVTISQTEQLKLQIQQLQHQIISLEQQIASRSSQIHDTAATELNNEYEVTSYSRYSSSTLYPIYQDSSKNVVASLPECLKKDLLQVQQCAQSICRSSQFALKNTTLDVIFRNIPTVGSFYQLSTTNDGMCQLNHNCDDVIACQCKNKFNSNVNNAYKLELKRPYLSLKILASEKIDKKYQVNVVYFANSDQQHLRVLVTYSLHRILKDDPQSFVTVVTNDTRTLQDILREYSISATAHNIKLIKANANLSRDRAFQIVTKDLQDESIVVMVDHHKIINGNFIQRCRLFARDSQVYSPVYFSLYNLDTVYKLHDLTAPTILEQIKISRYTGYWNSYGRGVLCGYKKYFPTNISAILRNPLAYHTWFQQRNISLIRATDPDSFQLWFKRSCKEDLSWEKYLACVKSRALHEVSHGDMGLLVDHLKGNLSLIK